MITIFTIMYFVTPKFKQVQKLTDDVNNVTRDNIIGVRVIRAFNAEKFHRDKFAKTNDKLTGTNLYIQKCFAFMKNHSQIHYRL